MRPRDLRDSIGRLMRYGLVGVGVSLFYSSVVIVIMSLRVAVSPTLASVIAFFLTMPVGWLAHRSLSFGDRPFDNFQPLRFAVTNGGSFVVAVGGMYVINGLAGYSYLYGIAWNWMIIPTMNFIVYLFWVFRESSAAGPQTAVFNLLGQNNTGRLTPGE